MSTRTILSVGQCRPDNAAIGHFLTSNFDVRLLTADFADEAMELLRGQRVDLVLVNRKLDADGSDGMAIIRSILQDGEMNGTRVMLVSNFEEWQQKATELGAQPGFGKAELSSEVARDRVAAALSA
jgi:DNA-binding response OmpR family regulator